MLIDIKKITSEGLSLSDHIELEENLLIEDGGYFIEDLHYNAFFVRHGDQIIVKGKIKTSLSLRCVRCLENFELKVNSRFDIILFPANLIHISSLHLNDDDMEYIFYEGNKIDIEKILMEQVNFFVPFNPLCHSACKGICPVCGVDLNHESCKCENSFNEMSLLIDKVKR